MPFFALVVDDPEKHHDAALRRQTAPNLELEMRKARTDARTERRTLSPLEEELVVARVKRDAQRKVGDKKVVGDLHTAMPSECPLGLPNCRNCGDPAHAAECRAKGHCPQCGRADGTGHGIAYQAYLAQAGTVMVEVDPPQPETQVDTVERSQPGVRADEPLETALVVTTERDEWDREQRKFVRRSYHTRYPVDPAEADLLERGSDEEKKAIRRKIMFRA